MKSAYYEYAHITWIDWCGDRAYKRQGEKTLYIKKEQGRKLHSWMLQQFIATKQELPTLPAHCFPNRSNLKEMSPLQFCLPVFLGIQNKKNFSIPVRNSWCPVRSNRAWPSHPLEKIPKRTLFNPCLKFKIFLGRMSSFKVPWKCHFVIL